jgi:hypothetical protein
MTLTLLKSLWRAFWRFLKDQLQKLRKTKATPDTVLPEQTNVEKNKPRDYGGEKIMTVQQTCRLDAPKPDETAMDRELHELERLVAELVDPEVLSFKCLPVGARKFTEEGYPYMAWFTDLASGETFPVNFTFECETTPIDIWVDPDWFSGSIYVVLGIHRQDFVQRLLNWADLQWSIKLSRQSPHSAAA